jgi:hypothetical protein
VPDRFPSGEYPELRGTQGFSVRAFGCSIQLETACADAYAVLERYVLPSLPRTAGNTQPGVFKPDIFIRIDRQEGRQQDQLQLSVDGVVVASAAQAIALAPDLIRAVDDAVLEHMKSFRAVHAGVVLCGDRAVLLPGATRAGKSSLVAELLRRGATYFSDEYALIDSEGRVHPYPRPLLLRDGCSNQSPTLPAEFNAPVGNAPAPIGWILSLEYQPESTWNLTPVSQGEGLLILLRNTPHVLAGSPDMVAVFQRAVAGVSCYAGCRSEAAHTAGQILRLIDASIA